MKKSWFKQFLFRECLGLYWTVAVAVTMLIMFCAYAYMWNS